MAEDPRLSDAATGLPPLDHVDPDDTLLVLGWVAGAGIATSPVTGDTVACRFLSVRGLTRGTPGDPLSPEWAQIHLAVPGRARGRRGCCAGRWRHGTRPVMQLWLVALGAVLLWRADVSATRSRLLRGYNGLEAIVQLFAGYGLLAASVVLTFVAGGTVG